MLNEVLFFQTRIFRMFCIEVKVSPAEADVLFNKYEIWKYLEEAYDVFLEYRWKMKEAELNRLIEKGLISKEELETEM